MTTEERRNCQNPNHPFKQKWYRYQSKYDDPNFCSSCSHSMRSIVGAFRAIISVFQDTSTLYGDKTIHTSDSQFRSYLEVALKQAKEFYE